MHRIKIKQIVQAIATQIEKGQLLKDEIKSGSAAKMILGEKREQIKNPFRFIHRNSF